MGLPIDDLLPRIHALLAEHTRLVLEAPPGAGKSTRVPLALLDAAWLGGQRILLLEPRRVAARAVAGFMAESLGETAGETVGYRIRFESRVGPRSRIEVLTEGLLTRRLQDDPLLEGVGAIVFDEFHERHLAGDLGLALALDVQASVRPDLRLLLMSATLDGERLASWLDAPRVSSAGRSFPVTVQHRPAPRELALEPHIARLVTEALAAHAGDVLVFLPGQREIAKVMALLASRVDAALVEVLPLHGELPVEQQARVLHAAADGRRRVVLATNVAESSVTLPGVRVVVDSGLAREPRFDPNSGFTRLQRVAISQASAVQRAGRAGRVAEGWCWRAWPESQRLDAARRAEISQADLAPLVLELAAWGEGTLRFPEPPPAGAMAAGRDLLKRLDALDDHDRITTRGRAMLALGTSPRLAAMLHVAAPGPLRALACDLAALLEARDPLSGGDALAARWQALAAWRGGRGSTASASALRMLDQLATQWRRRVRERALPPAEVPAHVLGGLLAHACPDRIARQHATDPRRYQLANGRSARLADDSALLGEPWLVVDQLLDARPDARILRAAPLDEMQLRTEWPQHFHDRHEVRWDGARQALLSERVQRFDGIVLDARPAGTVDPTLAMRALLDAVGELGLEVLPWSESLRAWRTRVQCLTTWRPELGLPDLGAAALLATRAQWLLPCLAGVRRLDAIPAEALTHALHALLDGRQRKALAEDAPERISVPSGQSRAISYALDADGTPAAPVLAVKLQELFGLADTPRIAGGRVPLTLHLLSPGGKPLQITRDLASFWNTTYPEVRREMKGRYPRHPWPDDPWNATPTHRAKPRGM